MYENKKTPMWFVTAFLLETIPQLVKTSVQD